MLVQMITSCSSSILVEQRAQRTASKLQGVFMSLLDAVLIPLQLCAYVMALAREQNTAQKGLSEKKNWHFWSRVTRVASSSRPWQTYKSSEYINESDEDIIEITSPKPYSSSPSSSGSSTRRE